MRYLPHSIILHPPTGDYTRLALVVWPGEPQELTFSYQWKGAIDAGTTIEALRLRLAQMTADWERED